MKAFFTNELTRLFLFVILCLIIAAVATPSVYSWGKGFAASHAGGEHADWLESLRKSMARGDFARYFNRVFMASALILLYPFIRSLKGGNVEVKSPLLTRMNPRWQGWKDLIVGFVYAIGYMGMFLLILLKLGWLRVDPAAQIGSAIVSALTTAFIVAIIEEWIFRGVLYDLLRRSLSPKKTIIGLSAFFAAVHFLKPFHEISDPHSATAGFELLGQIGIKFLHPELLFGVFITLFVVGVVLAYARHKSSFLWLSIGLHAGWVFYMKFFNAVTIRTGEAHPLLYGKDMREGILPLAFVVLTGLAIFFYLRPKKAFLP